MKYKITSHKYKLYFMPKNNVLNVVDESFPTKNYTVRSFADILSASDIDENELFGTSKYNCEFVNIIKKNDIDYFFFSFCKCNWRSCWQI